jgi:CHAD domain-containing protein
LAYRFKFDDETVGAGVRRIAIGQIDKAIAELDDPSLDARVTVHQVRKRCKKVRGLLRLIRPVFPHYRSENAAYRDAAAELSFLRDTEALIETYDRVTGLYEAQIDRPAFASIRRRLTLRQQEAEARTDIAERLDAFREEMVEAKVRALRWTLKKDGADAFVDGVAGTYGRARKAMKAARRKPTAEVFHDWRKRIKYHGFHARLLTPAWEGPMAAHHAAADMLGKTLGAHHDLDVFAAVLAAEPDAYGSAADIEVFRALMEQQRTGLEASAFEIGARLLCEPADALADRWGGYWRAWRKTGDLPAEQAA